MKDFVKDVVNDGEFLLKDILKERVGVNRPRTLIGVWIDEENRWEKIKVHKNDIVSEAKRRGINLKFDEEKYAINFRYYS